MIAPSRLRKVGLGLVVCGGCLVTWGYLWSGDPATEAYKLLMAAGGLSAAVSAPVLEQAAGLQERLTTAPWLLGSGAASVLAGLALWIVGYLKASVQEIIVAEKSVALSRWHEQDVGGVTLPYRRRGRRHEARIDGYIYSFQSMESMAEYVRGELRHIE